MSSTSPKPPMVQEPVGLFDRGYRAMRKGLMQLVGPLVLPAPAALHADIASTGAALNITTGFAAMPYPARCVRLTLAGAMSVAGRVTIYGKRLGLDNVQTIGVSGEGDFDGVIALDEITRLTTDKDLKGTLSVKTGLGFGLPNAIDEIGAVAVDGVRITADVDWATGTVRLPGNAPDGTKKFTAEYRSRYEPNP